MIVTERLPRESARSYAFRILKKNIVMLELRPGSMVSESELAAEMGLSRTPVREALIELSKTHIVEILPQRGSFVAAIDYTLVEEARFMRLVLESAVVSLDCDVAQERDFMEMDENLKTQEFYVNNGYEDKFMEADDEFHKMLFKICNKMITYQMLASMTTHFDRVRRLSLNAVEGVKLLADHREILENIRLRDGDAAQKAITKHLSRYRIHKDLIRKEHSSYFK